MSNPPRYVAIGLTFSDDTLRLMMEVLGDPRFDFAGEGTMASGYELYVAPDLSEEAIELIKNSPRMEGHKIEYYDHVREFNDGTRYDRLKDHFGL